MSSITPSPAGSRRRSSGQRSPAGNSLIPPPPSGPAVTRTGSRHRNPVSTQNAWPATTGSTPRPGLSPQPYHPASTPGLGALPASQYNNPGQLVAWPGLGYSGNTHPPLATSPMPPGPGHTSGPPTTTTTGVRKKRLILACDGKFGYFIPLVCSLQHPQEIISMRAKLTN